MKYYHEIILIRLKGDYIRFSAFLQLFQCFYSVFFHAICFLKRLQELIFISSNFSMFIFAAIPFAAPGTEVMTPISSSSRSSRITYSSARSMTLTPSFFATYSFASPMRIFFENCILATRSPAALIPVIPEAIMWEIGIPSGSPTPIYMPSTPAISTIALLALVTASIGGVSSIGIPPTPIPMST